MPIWSPGRHTPTQKIPKCPPGLHGGTLPLITGFCVSLPIKKSCPILVCYTAVFSVVTQCSSPQRCVTTLKTAVQQTSPIPAPINIGPTELERVSEFKLLGIYVQNDLKWNTHVSSIVSKACKRIHYLRVCRTAHLPRDISLTTYISLRLDLF